MCIGCGVDGVDGGVVEIAVAVIVVVEWYSGADDASGDDSGGVGHMHIERW